MRRRSTCAIVSVFLARLSLQRFSFAFALLLILLSSSACGVVGYGASKGLVKRPVYYQIQRGDNLDSIGQRFETDSSKLLLLNGLKTSRDLRVGQKILVGYRYYEAPGGGVKKASLKTSPKVDGRVQYSGGKLQWPLEEPARIVSTFGYRGLSFHDGLDIASPEGTGVVSAHDGIVAYSGDDLSGYGNLIILKGKDGLVTVYAHNSELLVDKGERVSKGDKIAEVGSTGRSSGPHLHFEVRMKDKRGRLVAIDPLPLLRPESEEKPRFRVNESLSPLLAWLD